MKITKYEHAGLVVEDSGEILVVDPGVLTKLPDLSSVKAVVITHIHPDHLHMPNLQKLAASNPALKLFATDEVIGELTELEVEKVSVTSGEKITEGVFTVEFFGSEHAIIYQKVPCKNIGVMINEQLYYPGDSFTLPQKPVEVLAFPAGGPWMKVCEAVEFIKDVAPKTAFPTHNGTLSEFGEMVNYFYIEPAITELGGSFVKLEPGQSL